jgi:hypothetical protein
MTSRILRNVLLTAAAIVVATAFAFPISAQDTDPFAGTWTLNVAKSKYDPGPAPKSGAVTFSSKGASITAVITGVSATGENLKWSYTGMIDGKDHAMTGTPDGDTITLRRISATSIETTYKLKGKVTVVNVRSVSADGKTMTVTTKGTTAAGEKVNNVQIFEKKM